MAKIQNWECDACGKQKGVANHWWQVTKVTTADRHSFELELFNAKSVGLEVYCGEQCLGKAMSQWISELTSPVGSRGVRYSQRVAAGEVAERPPGSSSSLRHSERRQAQPVKSRAGVVLQ